MWRITKWVLNKANIVEINKEIIIKIIFIERNFFFLSSSEIMIRPNILHRIFTNKKNRQLDIIHRKILVKKNNNNK